MEWYCDHCTPPTDKIIVSFHSGILFKANRSFLFCNKISTPGRDIFGVTPLGSSKLPRCNIVNNLLFYHEKRPLYFFFSFSNTSPSRNSMVGGLQQAKTDHPSKHICSSRDVTEFVVFMFLRVRVLSGSFLLFFGNLYFRVSVFRNSRTLTLPVHKVHAPIFLVELELLI